MKRTADFHSDSIRHPLLPHCAYGATHLPVLALVDALRVGPGKAALAVEGRDGGAELGHGVQVGGEVVQHGDHVGGQRRPLGPLLGHPVHLDKHKGKMCTGDIKNICLLIALDPASICLMGLNKERRSKVKETETNGAISRGEA